MTALKKLLIVNFFFKMATFGNIKNKKRQIIGYFKAFFWQQTTVTALIKKSL